MSPTIVSLIVNFLVMVLPLIGLDVGSESLVTTIQTLVTLVTGIIIWVRHLNLKKQLLGADRVNFLGGVKN